MTEHLDKAAARLDQFIEDRGIEPTATPAGAEVLNEVRVFLSRFVSFPHEAALDAVTLWAAHCHLIDKLESSPRLALTSPEPACGKTRALEVLHLLTPRPLNALNASPAPIFRLVDAGARDGAPVTLLFDECDHVFKSKRGEDPHADLRALLNAGHRRGASIPRCVGPTHRVKRFAVFAAVAMAGIGDPPPTLASRSIRIFMKRRAAGEMVEAFRFRRHSREGDSIRGRLAEWAKVAASGGELVEPEMPEGVTDRPADVWEPLLIVADLAGGHWPSSAREACCAFVAAAGEADDKSLGILLLEHLRGIFAGDRALSTAQILEELHALEEAPWGDLRGRPLDPRGLARLLRPYEVKSKQVKLADGRSLKGYHSDDLAQAWGRYLPEEGKPPNPPKPDFARGASMVSEVSEVSHTRQAGGLILFAESDEEFL